MNKFIPCSPLRGTHGRDLLDKLRAVWGPWRHRNLREWVEQARPGRLVGGGMERESYDKRCLDWGRGGDFMISEKPGSRKTSRNPQGWPQLRLLSNN